MRTALVGRRSFLKARKTLTNSKLGKLSQAAENATWETHSDVRVVRFLVNQLLKQATRSSFRMLFKLPQLLLASKIKAPALSSRAIKLFWNCEICYVN